MKIAFVSDDGVTIHSHFGQAQFYQVVTIENNQVIAREQRAKPSHRHGAHNEHQHGVGGDTHASGMASVIADCQMMVARGMGQPAYNAVQAAGIQPVLTELQTIDQATQAYLNGKLAHHDNRIHHK